jgi:hypothetical protein
LRAPANAHYHPTPISTNVALVHGDALVIDWDEAEANPLVHILVTIPVGIKGHFRFIDSH